MRLRDEHWVEEARVFPELEGDLEQTWSHGGRGGGGVGVTNGQCAQITPGLKADPRRVYVARSYRDPRRRRRRRAGAHLAAGRRAPGRRVRARGRRAVPLNGPRRLPRAPRPPRCGPVLGAAGESPCEPERRAAGALPAAGRTGPAPAGTPTSRRPRVPPPHFPRTPRRARPRLPQCPSSRRAPPAELAGGARAWGGARPGRAAPRPAERAPGLRASPLLPGFSGRSGHSVSPDRTDGAQPSGFALMTKDAVLLVSAQVLLSVSCGVSSKPPTDPRRGLSECLICIQRIQHAFPGTPLVLPEVSSLALGYFQALASVLSASLWVTGRSVHAGPAPAAPIRGTECGRVLRPVSTPGPAHTWREGVPWPQSGCGCAGVKDELAFLDWVPESRCWPSGPSSVPVPVQVTAWPGEGLRAREAAVQFCAGPFFTFPLQPSPNGPGGSHAWALYSQRVTVEVLSQAAVRAQASFAECPRSGHVSDSGAAAVPLSCRLEVARGLCEDDVGGVPKPGPLLPTMSPGEKVLPWWAVVGQRQPDLPGSSSYLGQVHPGGRSWIDKQVTGGDRQDPVILPTESPHSLPPPRGARDGVAETSLVVPVEPLHPALPDLVASGPGARVVLLEQVLQGLRPPFYRQPLLQAGLPGDASTARSPRGSASCCVELGKHLSEATGPSLWSQWLGGTRDPLQCAWRVGSTAHPTRQQETAQRLAGYEGVADGFPHLPGGAIWLFVLCPDRIFEALSLQDGPRPWRPGGLGLTLGGTACEAFQLLTSANQLVLGGLAPPGVPTEAPAPRSRLSGGLARLSRAALLQTAARTSEGSTPRPLPPSPSEEQSSQPSQSIGGGLQDAALGDVAAGAWPPNSGVPCLLGGGLAARPASAEVLRWQGLAAGQWGCHGDGPPAGCEVLGLLSPSPPQGLPLRLLHSRSSWRLRAAGVRASLPLPGCAGSAGATAAAAKAGALRALPPSGRPPAQLLSAAGPALRPPSAAARRLCGRLHFPPAGPSGPLYGRRLRGVGPAPPPARPSRPRFSESDTGSAAREPRPQTPRAGSLPTAAGPLLGPPLSPHDPFSHLGWERAGRDRPASGVGGREGAQVGLRRAPGSWTGSRVPEAARAGRAGAARSPSGPRSPLPGGRAEVAERLSSPSFSSLPRATTPARLS
nr:collagen alpha-1(I) chain-like [Kogia breviceps]